MNRKKGLTNEEAYKLLFEDIPDDTDTEVESSEDETDATTEQRDNFSSVFDRLLALEGNFLKIILYCGIMCAVFTYIVRVYYINSYCT